MPRTLKLVHSQEQINATQKYVNEQLAIMERFGDKPNMTPERYGKLVRDILKHVPAKPQTPSTGAPGGTEK